MTKLFGIKKKTFKNLSSSDHKNMLSSYLKKHIFYNQATDSFLTLSNDEHFSFVETHQRTQRDARITGNSNTVPGRFQFVPKVMSSLPRVMKFKNFMTATNKIYKSVRIGFILKNFRVDLHFFY